MRKRNILLIGLLLFLCMGSFDPFNCNISVTGKVTYSFPPGTPAKGVSVVTTPGDYSSVTNESGEYSIENMPKEDYYDLKVSTHGYIGSSRIYPDTGFSCIDSSNVINKDITILVGYAPGTSTTDSLITDSEIIPTMINGTSAQFHVVISSSADIGIVVTDLYLHVKRNMNFGQIEYGHNYFLWDVKDDDANPLENGGYYYICTVENEIDKQIAYDTFTILRNP